MPSASIGPLELAKVTPINAAINITLSMKVYFIFKKIFKYIKYIKTEVAKCPKLIGSSLDVLSLIEPDSINIDSK